MSEGANFYNAFNNNNIFNPNTTTEGDGEEKNDTDEHLFSHLNNQNEEKDEKTYNTLDFNMNPFNQEEKSSVEIIEQKIDETKSQLKNASRKRLEAGADVKEELQYIDIVRKIERAGDCVYAMMQWL